MRKVIAAFNMTLDGVCDHTTGVASEELHQHYSDLVDNAGVILYGRTTYELMQFWQTLLQNPSGKKSMDDFAISIDKIPKLVFSNTLKDTELGQCKTCRQSTKRKSFGTQTTIRKGHFGGKSEFDYSTVKQ